MSKYDIIRIESFYMSVLEHEWVIIFEGQNSFDIENLVIEAGVGNFNSVKIVPLKKYDDVLKYQIMSNIFFLLLFFDFDNT